MIHIFALYGDNWVYQGKGTPEDLKWLQASSETIYDGIGW